MLAACLALGGASRRGLAAQEGPPAPETTHAGAPSHRASPFGVMMRSAVVPGWGQLYNHKPIKAAVVVGGEGTLIYKAWTEFQKEQDAADAGDIEGKDRHYNLKVNYIWWAIAVHLLQMADAYVDAHLATFDADFGQDATEHAEGSPPDPGRSALPSVRVAVHVHF